MDYDGIQRGSGETCCQSTILLKVFPWNFREWCFNRSQHISTIYCVPLFDVIWTFPPAYLFTKWLFCSPSSRDCSWGLGFLLVPGAPWRWRNSNATSKWPRGLPAGFRSLGWDMMGYNGYIMDYNGSKWIMMDYDGIQRGSGETFCQSTILLKVFSLEFQGMVF